MPAYDVNRLAALWRAVDGASNNQDKGASLENLFEFLLAGVPGIEVVDRDCRDKQGFELDLVCWNDRHEDGFFFLPHVIIVEAKNWSGPVDADAVTNFDQDIRLRSLDFGLLVALEGVTGTNGKAAQDVIRSALQDGRQIIVMTRDELENARSSEDLCRLIKEGICRTVLRRSYA